ncbi:hypothetical protein E1281_25325 [Actinomadura sp. KC345]|uniref:hypothetical protein n=1 Tax=Actinomadura sp. KC345 TaxID=2530371 RepID=UPI0010483EEE|nr:hypothetical protein [Actinomadura sp. KC345]TDC48068.1 hypothetical protein E1281_25325 [Actinomadura sp. KC345]
MPSNDDRASRNPGAPPIGTAEWARARDASAEAYDRAVLILPGDGTLWVPDQSSEGLAVNDDVAWLLEDLSRYVGAVALLTGTSIQTLQRSGVLPERWIHVIGRSGQEHHHGGTHTVWVPVPEGLPSFGERLSDFLGALGLAGGVHVEDMACSMTVRYGDLEKAQVPRLLEQLRLLATAGGLELRQHDDFVEVGTPTTELGTFTMFIAQLWFVPSAVLYVGDCERGKAVFAELDRLSDDEDVPTLGLCASRHGALHQRDDMIVGCPESVREALEELHEVITR